METARIGPQGVVEIGRRSVILCMSTFFREGRAGGLFGSFSACSGRNVNFLAIFRACGAWPRLDNVKYRIGFENCLCNGYLIKKIVKIND